MRELAEIINAEVVEREENLSLVHSLVTGIAALWEQYDRGIALEDDFVVKLDFNE